MINIKKLSQKDIGRKVIYQENKNKTPQDGTITSFNNRYIFVNYSTGNQGIATSPKDLNWLT